MEVMNFINGFFETEEKKELIRYFIGSKENCKVLMNLLIKGKAINSCGYNGDDKTRVYFICNGKIRILPKDIFEYLIGHELNVEEIKAPIYNRISSLCSFYSADRLGLTTFYKEDDKYLECKLVDAHFIADDGREYILIKVKRNKGWGLRLIDKDIEKAELYI